MKSFYIALALTVLVYTVNADDCSDACPQECGLEALFCIDIPQVVDCSALRQSCLENCEATCQCESDCRTSCAADRAACDGDDASTLQDLNCEVQQQECETTCTLACPEEVEFDEAEAANA